MIAIAPPEFLSNSSYYTLFLDILGIIPGLILGLYAHMEHAGVWTDRVYAPLWAVMERRIAGVYQWLPIGEQPPGVDVGGT